MFIRVVLTGCAILLTTAWFLWRQFVQSQEKRIQRLRSLSSRLPKIQSQSPQKLEQRRLGILFDKTSKNVDSNKYMGFSVPRITERTKLPTIEKTKLDKMNPNPAELHPPYQSFSKESDFKQDVIIPPSSSPPSHTDGYEELTDVPVLNTLVVSSNCEENHYFELTNNNFGDSEPPGLLPISPSSKSSKGYSLLASLVKKKKKSAMRGYKIFTGSNSTFPTISLEDMNANASSDDKESDEDDNIQDTGYSKIDDSPIISSKVPDSYKYITKQTTVSKKIACYKNPYTNEGGLQLGDNTPSLEGFLRPYDEKGEYNRREEEDDEYDDNNSAIIDNSTIDGYNDFDGYTNPSSENNSYEQIRNHPTNLRRKRNASEIRRKQKVYKRNSEGKLEKYIISSKNETSETSNNSNGTIELPQIPKRVRSCTTERMLRLSEERCRNRDPVPVGGMYDEFDHLLDGVDLHDWNERFQRIMTTIRKFNCNTAIALQIKANRALIHLAQDFIYASSTYGKIIISEVYSAEKTIKPINLGGKLGGTKYIVQNILFKFAVDESGLYSDYAAAKVAGHELKGLINYFNCNIENLCLPLMSLVDYRGFRLIAMSILPIRGSETIIYGSDNYGETIHNRNSDMNHLLKRTAKMMNIKEHECGTNLKTSNFLCSPADLEGHLGTDDRFYLLDFSRVLPPETPVKGIQNAHLYRLLRPELVKQNPNPLCSDAFSGFIANFNYKKDNTEIIEATNRLINEIIPTFASDLTTMMLEARDKGSLESFRLTEAIHRQGINVRYLGLLRSHIKELDPRTFLLIEMSARIVKNKLRKLLRKKMKELQVPLEEPYRRLVISYLNLVLGDSEASEEYWNNNIKNAMQRTFVGGLSEQEINVAYSLKSSLNNFSNDRVDGKLLLFLRLQKMTGLRFTNRINEEFTQNPNNWAPRGAQPLDETDLEDIGLRVKHMNIISHAQGFVLQMKGAMAWAHDPVAAERFYNMAITKYEEALDTNPNDYQALIRCAEIAVQFIEGHARGVAAMKYNIEMPQVQYANMLYQRAATANPNDSYGLYKYAQFLDKCNIPDTAEEMFLRSLEADPENVACLQEYGNFLSEKSKHDIAELFYVRGSELAQKYSTNESQLQF